MLGSPLSLNKSQCGQGNPVFDWTVGGGCACDRDGLVTIGRDSPPTVDLTRASNWAPIFWISLFGMIDAAPSFEVGILGMFV